MSLLRVKLADAVVAGVASPEELAITSPLVEAFVRSHHHPLAAMSVFRSAKTDGKIECGPRLLEIAAEHPELDCDLTALQAALVCAIRLRGGENELDDSRPPWLMHWANASAAAGCLICFVTLKTLGDLTIGDDDWEAGVAKPLNHLRSPLCDPRPARSIGAAVGACGRHGEPPWPTCPAS